jgi:isopenicillin-N epimerase
VFEAQQRWQREMERNPVAFLGRLSAELLEDARSKLAAALGASGDHMVFVPNATTAVNIVAQSFPFAAGDDVLTTQPGIRGLRCGLGTCVRETRRPIPARGDPLPFVRAMISWSTCLRKRRRKRGCSSSATSRRPPALTLPIAALCSAARERGIATLIDGAHAPGHIPLIHRPDRRGLLRRQLPQMAMRSERRRLPARPT